MRAQKLADNNFPTFRQSRTRLWQGLLTREIIRVAEPDSAFLPQKNMA